MLKWDFIVIVGLIGQGMFSMRFILQWIASEKAQKSVIPFSFWIFSLAGSLILLFYAIYRKDPVFILGQAPGLIIYSRNIWLIKKNEKKEKELNSEY